MFKSGKQQKSQNGSLSFPQNFLLMVSFDILKISRLGIGWCYMKSSESLRVNGNLVAECPCFFKCNLVRNCSKNSASKCTMC